MWGRLDLVGWLFFRVLRWFALGLIWVSFGFPSCIFRAFSL
jgi:hypothetical protein